MTQTEVLTIAASLVACMFGLLATVVGWMGARVIVRLDAMVEKLNAVSTELHTRINGIDTRLTRVETLAEHQ